MARITSAELRKLTDQRPEPRQESGRVVVTLPYPPTVNTYWRRYQGRTLISRKGRAYRREVEALLAGRDRLAGRLAVSIEAHAPDRRRRDLDNICKSLLDALQHGGLIEDDGDIDDLRIVRGEVDKDDPRVELTIERQAQEA